MQDISNYMKKKINWQILFDAFIHFLKLIFICVWSLWLIFSAILKSVKKAFEQKRTFDICSVLVQICSTNFSMFITQNIDGKTFDVISLKRGELNKRWTLLFSYVCFSVLSCTFSKHLFACNTLKCNHFFCFYYY